MFRKGPHLKDRLKQQFHHHQHAPGHAKSRSRTHPHVKNTTMSFSAVDNEAFEQILDDESDFIGDFVAPPPPTTHPPSSSNVGAPSSRGANVGTPSSRGANVGTPSDTGQPSDLFDTDMFVVVDREGAQSGGPGTSNDPLTPASSSVPPHGVNCDPLSGQIVSEVSVVRDDVSGMEIRNETGRDEMEIKNETGGDGAEDIASESSNLEISGVTIDSGFDQSQGSEKTPKLAIIDEPLFDRDPSPEEDQKQDQPSDAADDLSHTILSDDQTPKPVTVALNIPRLDDSPLSSVPSSFEADALHNISFTAEETASISDEVHEVGESNHTSSFGSDNQSTVSGKEQALSHADSSMSDLEAELEELLAPKASSRSFTNDPSPSSSTSTSTTTDSFIQQQSSHAPQLHPLADREGSHLDSGVFENDGKELDSTPEREGGAGGEKTPCKDESFEIHDDHFTKNIGQTNFVTSSTARFTNQNHTTTSPSKPTVGSSNADRKNSAGKIPPPRPARPPSSPQLWKKPKSSTAMSHSSAPDRMTSGGVVKDGEVAVKIVRPLGKTRENVKPVVVTTRVEGEGGVHQSGEELSSDDDLFPNDSKMVREMEELVASRRKQAGTTTTPLAANSSPNSASLPHASSDSNGKTTEMDLAQEARMESEFELGLPYHLLLSLLLYLYYSLNFSSYLAGLFAGFLMLYVCLGAVFVYYVHVIEREREEKTQAKRRAAVEVSEDFLRTMKVDFQKLNVYKSDRFTATLSYDASTHHPSQRMRAELKLNDDFKFFVHVIDHEHVSPLCTMVDIRECRVSIEPPEVAKNRKRRWSKKFPFVVSYTTPPKKFKVYLFSPTAREKEDWFRRIKSAASGLTSKQLIEKQKEFFSYMEKYFPADMLKSVSLRPPALTSRRSPSYHNQHHPHRASSSSHRMANTLVQFSKSADNDDATPLEDSEVNITRKSTSAADHSPQTRPRHSAGLQSGSSSVSGGGVRGHESSVDASNGLLTLDEDGFEHVHYPPPAPSTRSNRLTGYTDHRPNQWLNSLAARLCWDVWHEQRWKDWVMTRIQKKLVRIKTPSFMESLRLTNVDIGNDMPMINRLIGGPRLDLRGVWVYLDVTYKGKFVMTIETKMKLGKNSSGGEEGGQQMTAITRSKEDSSLPVTSPHTNLTHQNRSPRPLSHIKAAQALAGSGKGSSVDPDDDIDSGSDDDSTNHPLMEAELTNSQINELDPQDHTPSTDQAPPSSMNPSAGKGRLKSTVTRMAKNVAKKVANTKIVQRAAEKVSSYPLVLTVEVNKLEGILVVNLPPPLTDTVWWGFHGSPKLELVAKPKLGHREVKLSKVTHWIEKKLCEIVEKKLVYPEMEDLVIPILNSGMAEDVQKPISSDSNQQTT